MPIKLTISNSDVSGHPNRGSHERGEKSDGFFSKILKAIRAMFAAFVALGVLMTVGGEGVQQAAKSNMDKIYTQVTNDQITQYNITRVGGVKRDMRTCRDGSCWAASDKK